MYVCTYVCMCVCMYAGRYVCMHVCMYVCMYECMYVCVRAYMHISLYTFYNYLCDSTSLCASTGSLANVARHASSAIITLTTPPASVTIQSNHDPFYLPSNSTQGLHGHRNTEKTGIRSTHLYMYIRDYSACVQYVPVCVRICINYFYGKH